MRNRNLVAALAAVWVGLAGSAAIAQEPPIPPLRGDTSASWGSDAANPCVPDVGAALSGVEARGELLGFHLNGAPDLARFGRHWQGVQRPMSGGGRYLIVSRSGSDVGAVVVGLESRGAPGHAFRSNRLVDGIPAERAAPPADDGVVAGIPHEPGFHHAGGMQVVGNVLAVPFDGHGSRVVFYDVADPTRPVRLSSLDHSAVRAPSDPNEAAGVGLARLADGRYLLMLGVHSSKVLELYVSEGTSLRDPSLSFRRLRTLVGAVTGGFQTINLVTQCDGRIFLVGTHNTGFPPPSMGGDRVKWYELGTDGNGELTLTRKGNKRVKCRRCNFGAAGGVYVDPERRLYVYGVEHDNDGPGGTVNVEEFLPRVAEPTPVVAGGVAGGR